MATVKVIPVPVVAEYVLTLSQEEVETMRRVFSKVGGDPFFSPRKHIRALDEALRLAGVPVPDVALSGSSIYFATPIG